MRLILENFVAGLGGLGLGLAAGAGAGAGACWGWGCGAGPGLLVLGGRSFATGTWGAGPKVLTERTET